MRGAVSGFGFPNNLELKAAKLILSREIARGNAVLLDRGCKLNPDTGFLHCVDERAIVSLDSKAHMLDAVALRIQEPLMAAARA